MKLSNSKVGTYQRCPKKYEFGYVLRLERKKKSEHLEKGSWLHTLLEVHYADDPAKVIEVGRKRRKVRVGRDWRKAHRALTQEFNNLFEEERSELGDLPTECERIMRSYLARYAEEDAGEETIAVELDEWVTLPNGDEFNFIIDQVLRKPDGGIWLRDHKSLGQFMPPEYMMLDTQLARYFWAFKRIKRFASLAPKLRGVEFNELRTKAPTIPEVVDNGKRLTKRANLDTDYPTFVRAIKDNGFDPKDYRDILTRLKQQDDRFFRRTTLPRDTPIVRQMMVDMLVTSAHIKRDEASGNFVRTVDKSCTWGCDFYELCAVDLHGGDISDIISLKYDVRERRSTRNAKPRATRR